MPSDLITIGSSGARAARQALDVASQNIANSTTQGYVRRSVRTVEVAATGTLGITKEASLSGARISGTIRNADPSRQAEMRRTGSELARADAELSGLEPIELALDNAGLFDAVVGFESALQRLSGDPVNPSLRASALESAKVLASSFNIASTQMDGIAANLSADVAHGVNQANLHIEELAKLNLKIARTDDGSSSKAVLLDQRDQLLQSLTSQVGISTRFTANAMVEVRLGGASGPVLVSGTDTQSLLHSQNGDGTIAFAVNGTPANITSGSVAGKAQGLAAVANAGTRLDRVAQSLLTSSNAAQIGGTALDGSPGQPMFAGTRAKDLAVALNSGAQIATAPAGAAANSLDGSNLQQLRSALSVAGVVSETNGLLFDASSAVAGRKITQSALDAIAQSASTAVNQQSAVDLDQEAADLLRYQQAFQASARIIQVASTIFDTLLATR